MTSTTAQAPPDALRGGDDGVHCVLRDGSTVRIRSVAGTDIVQLRTFLMSLSAESRLLRFFSCGLDIERTAQWVAHPETHDGFALVATTGADHRIIAHGSFERWHPDDARAEVALAVADSHQNLGLGTLLLGRLAEIASGHGVAAFIAHVLPQNHRMVRVLRNAGFLLTQRTVPGDIEIEFPTALTSEGRGRFHHREQIAATAAVRRVLAPRSVAVIGASRWRGKPGGAVFHNLITGGFAGAVYPVNAHASIVQSVPAYRSVADIPDTVDLAVIAVPAEHVLAVAGECATVGVRALVVLSAGFGETDDAGRQRQRDLLEMCRRSGVRLLGPNCLGVVNTDPAVGLNAQFGPKGATRGRVGLLTQSGLLGPAIIDRANALGLGLSSFVSVGNRADLSSNDLLHYWESDPQTDVILLDVGSFGNPRRFSRIARRLTRTKPVVAVTSGRPQAGVRAASSRAGALLAASDRTVDALFHQAGVIRTDTLSELFDVARLLVGQPVPAGSRVGIVTNAGEPGLLCADACAADGLDVVRLSDATRRALRTVLPRQVALGNPVVTAAAVTPDAYREAIRLVGASGEVDALITIYAPRLASDAVRFAAALRDASSRLDDGIAVVSVFMSSLATSSTSLHGEARVPMFAVPQDAVRALAHASRHGLRRRTPDGRFDEPAGVRHNEASALLAEATGAGPQRRWLAPAEVRRLFDCYGIRLVEEHAASAIEEAGEAHTSGDPGIELLIGVTADATFGPVVVCSAGGATVEHVEDTAVRIAPLTTRDAHDMLRELATFPPPDGCRGAPQAGVEAVADLLLRVSAMAEHQGAVAELDCSPVMVTDHGAFVIDARVLVDGSGPVA